MTTQNKGLNQPAYNSSLWDTPLNNNFGYIDAAFGNTAIVSNTSAYTLSSSEYQCMRLLFNGSLSSDVTISIPSGVGGFWIVTNSTTDLSTSAIKYLTINTTASGSLGVTPPRNSSVMIYSDGTNVGYTEGTAPVPSSTTASGSSLVIPGTIIHYAGPTAPTGYLVCDGSAVSRSSYSSLFAAIGTLWGSGNGTTTFNIPNLVNMFLRGRASSGTVGTYQADTFASHTHTDAGHAHALLNPYGTTAGAGVYPLLGLNPQTALGTTTGYASIQPTGDAETRPKNYSVLMCIKT